MFSSIGDILPRFRIFERLFPNHELLTQALSKVYVDIISFCTEAKRVFRDGQRSTSKSCNESCQEIIYINSLGQVLGLHLNWPGNHSSDSSVGRLSDSANIERTWKKKRD